MANSDVYSVWVHDERYVYTSVNNNYSLYVCYVGIIKPQCDQIVAESTERTNLCGAF